jgi:hypothetical protein
MRSVGHDLAHMGRYRSASMMFSIASRRSFE